MIPIKPTNSWLIGLKILLLILWYVDKTVGGKFSGSNLKNSLVNLEHLNIAGDSGIDSIGLDKVAFRYFLIQSYQTSSHDLSSSAQRLLELKNRLWFEFTHLRFYPQVLIQKFYGNKSEWLLYFFVKNALLVD